MVLALCLKELGSGKQYLDLLNLLDISFAIDRGLPMCARSHECGEMRRELSGEAR